MQGRFLKRRGGERHGEGGMTDSRRQWRGASSLDAVFRAQMQSKGEGWRMDVNVCHLLYWNRETYRHYLRVLFSRSVWVQLVVVGINKRPKQLQMRYSEPLHTILSCDARSSSYCVLTTSCYERLFPGGLSLDLTL